LCGPGGCVGVGVGYRFGGGVDADRVCRHDRVGGVGGVGICRHAGFDLGHDRCGGAALGARILTECGLAGDSV
jgi:hypothetical protein